MRILEKNPLLPVLLALSLIWSGAASGQGSSPHTVGGFVGFTDRTDADFTVGVEYEYDMQAPWSVGAILEYTPNAFFGRDFAVLLGTGNYRLPSMPQLKLTGGAGIEFRDGGGDDVRFRLGAGYDVLEGTVTVTPRFALDFGDGPDSIVLGISFLHNF